MCIRDSTNPVLTSAEFAELTDRVGARLGAEVVPPGFPAADSTVKTSAAWLIDHAGFGKGHGLPGPAALSSKHVLAVTNRGGASAADLLTPVSYTHLDVYKRQPGLRCERSAGAQPAAPGEDFATGPAGLYSGRARPEPWLRGAPIAQSAERLHGKEKV